MGYQDKNSGISGISFPGYSLKLNKGQSGPFPEERKLFYTIFEVPFHFAIVWHFLRLQK